MAATTRQHQGGGVRECVRVWVNGQLREVPCGGIGTGTGGGSGGLSLLSHLRGAAGGGAWGLTGAKEGCGEGDCCSCTVVLTYWDCGLRCVVHRAVNSCLMPIMFVDGMHVTTVEGLSDWKPSRHAPLHPIQTALANGGGTQCGFCSPGMVMAMHAIALSGTSSADNVDSHLDGNLCRCTGYRPIIQAARRLLATPENKSSDHRVASPEIHSSLGDIEDSSCGCNAPHKKVPEELLKQAISEPWCATSGDGRRWFFPTDLRALIQLRTEFPQSTLISGNTSIGIGSILSDPVAHSVIICVSRVTELHCVTLDSQYLTIGSATTLSVLEQVLPELISGLEAHKTQSVQALLQVIKKFGNCQIRNVATIGGNIATASPVSDICPLLLATGATLEIQSVSSQRLVPVSEFITGYRKTSLLPCEVITTIRFPLTVKNEFVGVYKQSRRKCSDIAIVSCAFRVILSEIHSERHSIPTNTGNQPDMRGIHWINTSESSLPHNTRFFSAKPPVLPQMEPEFQVSECSLSFSGVSSSPILAKRTSNKMIGQQWNSSVLPSVYTDLANEINLSLDAPGGMTEFRSALCRGFFFKFFIRTYTELYGQASLPPSLVSPPDCYGLQSSEVNFELVEKNGNSIVSTPLPHISSLKHVTGSALYTADVNCADVVHAAFIQSSQAHALIISIDKQKALSVPGVIAIFTSKDVPGTNLCGPVVADEELFASREVLCVGYPIGIVVATTQQIARRAAKLVEVTYESLPAILTIEEAIKLNSTLCEPLVISRGDVSLGFQEASQIISGDVSISGQEHFYIEPHATLVLPNLDSGIVVWSTTQNPSLIQSLISTTCGIASSKICVKCTQLGGGFGGKETRNGFIASACAVAATILNRPTKFVVDRDVDMSITGNRHPYLGKYKMGFNSSGQILSYEVDFFSNAGYSCDRSPSVMEQSIKCCPGPYYIPNVKATGHVMRTNRPSNTAFRGFGTPQALATLEEAVCKVASVLGTTPERIREVNFYREGQLTLYNQQLTDFTLPAIWASLLEKSDFRTRQIAIETYNATHRFSKRGISTLPTLQTVGYSEEFLNQAGALVNIYTDGSVMISHGGCEIGQGLHTKMAQIAASVLDVPIEYIHVGETSTDKVPNATSTAASSGADLNGRAVLHACSLLKNRLSTFKQSLGSEAASLSWGKLVEKAYFGRVDLSARGFTQVHGSPYYYHVYGAACSEVEIDVLTGDHTVLRSDIVVDAGVSINPVIDIGQVEGAFLQGQGWCTTEEVVTLRDGNIHTKGPSTYKVPAFCDVPRDFRVSLFPSHPRNFICLSSKGIGETPFYLGASVFFALQEAVTSARRDEGITGFYQLPHPATCEHIRLACRDSFTDLTPNGGVEGPSWSLDEFTLPPDILIQSTPPQSLP